MPEVHTDSKRTVLREKNDTMNARAHATRIASSRIVKGPTPYCVDDLALGDRSRDRGCSERSAVRPA